eukprot:CAMPEP_0181298980 /NCGR_PEP_ID=MMETSP1101-20121128/6082_1 /TAXON_ID=46948 /ORGANISM="Rhodomonas abbreviata, Strain Caron Lab Isolate" /LENGTH=122 /DNA_ID=CAMNT_0023404059 /DNA_START=210 /DNA_END=575 /DNA_ORIENTATION=+
MAVGNRADEQNQYYLEEGFEVRTGCHSVTSLRRERPNSTLARSTSLSALGLLLAAAVVCMVNYQSEPSVLASGDAGLQAYDVARARAHLAAAEVEEQNSKTRLRAMDALLASSNTGTTSLDA